MILGTMLTKWNLYETELEEDEILFHFIKVHMKELVIYMGLSFDSVQQVFVSGFTVQKYSIEFASIVNKITGYVLVWIKRVQKNNYLYSTETKSTIFFQSCLMHYHIIKILYKYIIKQQTFNYSSFFFLPYSAQK